MNHGTIQGIILAAGKSSRFQTGSSKLAATLCGQELILYPVKALRTLHIPVTLVVGHHKETLIDIINKQIPERVTFVEQSEQKGTGHALRCTQSSWHAEEILVMNGDAPLITPEVISTLIEQHQKTNATVSCLVAHHTPLDDHHYGRIVHENGVIKIVEARDFLGSPLDAPLINGGIYLFNKAYLSTAISELTLHSNSDEFYITDLIEHASQKGFIVTPVITPFDTLRGINTLKELWTAEHIKRSEIIEYWMERGVRFQMAQTNHVDLQVSIGAGTVIGAGVHIYANSSLGARVQVGTGSIIRRSIIHDEVTIKPYSIIEQSEIHTGAEVGPFAHIRNDSIIHKQAIIGNFVEMSKSILAEGAKAKHLTYLGNAHIGAHANIGAGTITCNYNGLSKNITTIEEHAHIGSNNSLVAPVRIGKYAVTGAGSVITDDVPDHALGIARARQINKEEYAKKLRTAERSFVGAKTSEPQQIV